MQLFFFRTIEQYKVEMNEVGYRRIEKYLKFDFLEQRSANFFSKKQCSTYLYIFGLTGNIWYLLHIFLPFSLSLPAFLLLSLSLYPYANEKIPQPIGHIKTGCGLNVTCGLHIAHYCLEPELNKMVQVHSFVGAILRECSKKK